MEEAIKIQEDFCSQLTRAQVNLRKTPKQRLTKTFVETKLESLNELWSEIKLTHKNIVKLATLEVTKSEKYFVNNVFESLEEEYTQYKCCLKEILSTFKGSCNESTGKSEANTTVKPPKLPDIKLPTFSGKYTEWPTFRDLFLSLVHKNNSLDKVQKLHYLKVYISGEAEQLLRHITTTDVNYDKCWNLLEERYNNKKFLSTCLLQRLFSQKNLSLQTASGIKELLDVTKDCMSALTNLGINVASWDVIIIYVVSMKLDTETRKQWEIKVSESNEDLPTFSQFEEFLIVWDDIIGEPEGARSPECAWRLSNVCFRHARNWCYTLLTVLIAPPCALMLGCGFACLAFEQIWCTAPCLRCVKIYFASLRTMVQSCMAATVSPTADAVGHICRHIRVNFRRDAPEERDLLVV